MAFLFSLRQPVVIAVSGERGEVIGRAEHAGSENTYFLRYCDLAGWAVEEWWAESALRAAATEASAEAGPAALVFEAPAIDHSCLQADVIWLKTYTPKADGTEGHDEHTVELHDALRPEITAHLAAGRAFQLVFWGQFRTPNLVPQAPSPEQPLTTRACATGTTAPDLADAQQPERPQGSLFAQRVGDRIPASYLPAALHCTLPRLDAQADAAFALETNGVVHRFRLDAANFKVLLETLDPAYWSSLNSAIADHSAGSSESPSAARSTPSAAENVCPPAASLTANPTEA